MVQTIIDMLYLRTDMQDKPSSCLLHVHQSPH
jgi:hypothetical protein